jgi:hypothetical protein
VDVARVITQDKPLVARVVQAVAVRLEAVRLVLVHQDRDLLVVLVKATQQAVAVDTLP